MNTMKTVMLMALLGAVMVAVGGALGGRSGMMIMLMISLAMNFMSYWYSDTMVLKMYNAKPIGRRQAPELYGLVEKLAQRANLPMPKVCVIRSEVANAFATGRNPEHAAVAVTTGIMQTLNYDELSGVLAHELSHIKHHDTLIQTVAASMATVISYVGQMAQWAAIFGSGRRDSDDDNGGALGLLFTIIVAPLAAMLIQLAISRSREYEADRAGGELCGNPRYLARALQRLEESARHDRYAIGGATPQTAHLFIVNPLANVKQTLSGLFSTHPHTAERIKLLEEQAYEMGCR